MTDQSIEVSSPLRQLLSGLTPTAAVCLGVLALLVIVVMTAPWIAPYGEG